MGSAGHLGPYRVLSLRYKLHLGSQVGSVQKDLAAPPGPQGCQALAGCAPWMCCPVQAQWAWWLPRRRQQAPSGPRGVGGVLSQRSATWALGEQSSGDGEAPFIHEGQVRNIAKRDGPDFQTFKTVVSWGKKMKEKLRFHISINRTLLRQLALASSSLE